MDNFKVIYKILKAFERNMDTEEPDWECIGAEQLGVSQQRWKHIIEMLVNAGYVDGIKIVSMADGTQVCFIRPRITLKGLEYLEENTLMQKVFRAMKGIKDITPGM